MNQDNYGSDGDDADPYNDEIEEDYSDDSPSEY